MVRIDDLSTIVAGKRAAELNLIRGSVLPAGYERPRFSGRMARSLDADTLKHLLRFVTDAQQALEIPGISLGVVQQGQVVYSGGFGVREIGSSARVDADTLYLIASNTKSLTTLMLASLVDEGRLSWEAPVTEILPDFRLADADLTSRVRLRHLACACAGLPYRNLDWEFAPPNSPASLALDILARMRPTSAFGSSYQYSNPPAAVAGLVGAHVAHPELELGEAYDRAMRERVFEPLGMTRTTFDFDAAMQGNYARSHGTGLDGRLALVDSARDRQIHAMRSIGGAWSNVNDILAYLKLELSGGMLEDGRRLLSQAALQARWAAQISTGPQASYGLGLDISHADGTPMLFHGGRLYGQRSNMVWWPEHDLGLVILMNASTGNVLMDAVPRKLMELLFDGPAEADSMVAAAVASERVRRGTLAQGWHSPADRDHVGVLAPHYRNALLGDLRVRTSDASTEFRFAAWSMPVASRINAQGHPEFIGTIPSPPPVLAAQRLDGRRTLTLRDAQNVYVFEEVD